MKIFAFAPIQRGTMDGRNIWEHGAIVQGFYEDGLIEKHVRYHVKGSNMELKPIQLKDKNGNIVSAAQAVCNGCGGNSFQIVVVDTHEHLICKTSDCKASYCQGLGKCALDPAENAGCDH